MPGGSQALKRTEKVAIAIDGGSPSTIRRPTLLGAILLKARALKVHERTEDQRQNLILLSASSRTQGLWRASCVTASVGGFETLDATFGSTTRCCRTDSRSSSCASLVSRSRSSLQDAEMSGAAR